jgi:hypothetical protein
MCKLNIRVFSFMRSTYTKILLIIFSQLVIHLQACAQEKVRDDRWRITASAVCSSEELSWSIAGSANQGNYVDILSELRWKNIIALGADVNVEYKIWRGLFLQSGFSKRLVINGTVTDTDYAENNRRGITFHDSFNADKGTTRDLAIALGYEFELPKNVWLAPTIGYTNKAQRLYMLRDFGNVMGNLRSTYEPTWQGVFAAIRFTIPLSKKLFLSNHLSYHQVNYTAAANWNLIQEFRHPVSFIHKAKGFGITNDLQIHYNVSRTFSILFGATYEFWKTGRGSDTLYLADGTTHTTRLNGVERKKYGVEIGVEWRF